MLIENICKNMKNCEKNKNMIRGIHYFSTELKTKIDVIPRSCYNIGIQMKRNKLTETFMTTSNWKKTFGLHGS